MSWQQDDEFCTAYNNFTCEYNPAQIELAYYFWKASRESIKVELPKIRKLEYNGNDNVYDASVYLYEGDFYEVQGVEDALDKAGVKY